MTSPLLWLLLLTSSSALSIVAAHDVPTITFHGQACDEQVTPKLYTSPSPGTLANLAECVELCDLSSDCASVTFFSLSKWCTHFYTPCASLKEGHGAITVTPEVDPYWTLASIGYGRECQGQPLDSSGKQESLAKCMTACDLVPECKSVTFSSTSKTCSHFSTTCEKSQKGAGKTVPMVKRTQQSKCDMSAGEIFRRDSSGEASNLATCKKSCEDDAECKGITYWTQSKYCSHFSTECTKRTPAPNVIAMTLTTTTTTITTITITTTTTTTTTSTTITTTTITTTTTTTATTTTTTTTTTTATTTALLPTTTTTTTTPPTTTPPRSTSTSTSTSHYKYDVLIMRHELAPGGGDPKGFVLSDCSTQRNLNQEGIQLASKTGKKLSSLTNLAPLIYSSQWCRCLDTATQIALELSDSSSINYTVEGTRGLNSFYQPSIGFTKEECMGWLTTDILDRLKKVERNDRVHQTLLVTHYVTVKALTGFRVESGGIVAYDSLTGDAARLIL